MFLSKVIGCDRERVCLVGEVVVMRFVQKTGIFCCLSLVKVKRNSLLLLELCLKTIKQFSELFFLLLNKLSLFCNFKFE